MKSIAKFQFIPPWKWFRELRWVSWSQQVLENQQQIQFCVCHRNRVKRDLLPLKVLLLLKMIAGIVVVVGVCSLIWLLLLLLTLLLLNWC